MRLFTNGDSMRIKNLSKYYDGIKGIENININIQNKCVYAVLGHNGSGKSTLFRTVLGLIPNDSGNIEYNTVKNIGYVPEYRALYQNMTVERQIRFMARLRKMTKEETEKSMTYWLKEFKIEDKRHDKIQILSKGNQQKVQFICALIHNPDLILLDEPMTGLDIVNINLFKDVISKLMSENKKIIMSSHQYDELEEFCDYILILKKGDVMLQGPVKQIKKDFDYEYISVTYDEHASYKEQKDVLSYTTKGHQTRYKVKKDSKLIQEIIKKRNIQTVKIESVSLKDLVNYYYA